jgi:hypothetical protein
MSAWYVQRRARVAPQDSRLYATSRGRDPSYPFGRIPYVQHVRQVGIARVRDNGQDALAVAGDQFLQLFLVRHLTCSSAR